MLKDEAKLKAYINTELSPLLRRVFNHQNLEWASEEGVRDRVFVTTDEKNQRDALAWGEGVSSLVLNERFEEERVFGTVAEDGFIEPSEARLRAALDTVSGGMGEAYREKKNVFSIAAVNTNHVFSVRERVACEE